MKFYTIPEVAALANVTPSTVRNWVKQGKLEAAQTKPRELSVSEEALIKFVQENPKKVNVMDILESLNAQRKAAAEELSRIDKCISEMQQLYRKRTKNSKICYTFY